MLFFFFHRRVEAIAVLAGFFRTCGMQIYNYEGLPIQVSFELSPDLCLLDAHDPNHARILFLFS